MLPLIDIIQIISSVHIEAVEIKRLLILLAVRAKFELQKGE